MTAAPIPLTQDPDPAEPPPRPPRRLLGPVLALPGIVWLFLFFVAPLYVVLSVVFGGVDPVFRTVIPVWNPILWSSDQPIYVLTHIVGKNGIFGPALLRTAVYVLTASVLCLVIAFPIAYYVARLAGRWRGALLALLIGLAYWFAHPGGNSTAAVMLDYEQVAFTNIANQAKQQRVFVHGLINF